MPLHGAPNSYTSSRHLRMPSFLKEESGRMSAKMAAWCAGCLAIFLLTHFLLGPRASSDAVGIGSVDARMQRASFQRELVPVDDHQEETAQVLKSIDLVATAPPPSLKHPVLWAAPFYSQSGYGSEAISFVSALLRYNLLSEEDLYIMHSGDVYNQGVVDAMDPELLSLLQRQEYHNITERQPPHLADRKVIVLCHTFPTCWRQPARKRKTGRRPGNADTPAKLLADAMQGHLQNQPEGVPPMPVIKHEPASAPQAQPPPEHQTPPGTPPVSQTPSPADPSPPRSGGTPAGNLKAAAPEKSRPTDSCPCPSKDIAHKVVYKASRTMFETASLPAQLAACVAVMDEVLVPSQFNVDSFKASGHQYHTVQPNRPAGRSAFVGGVLVFGIDPVTQKPPDIPVFNPMLSSGGKTHFKNKRRRNTGQRGSGSSSDGSGQVQSYVRSGKRPPGNSNSKAAAALAAVNEELERAAAERRARKAKGKPRQPHERILLADGKPASTGVADSGGVHTPEAAHASTAQPQAPADTHTPQQLPNQGAAKADNGSSSSSRKKEQDAAQLQHPFRFLSVFKWEDRKGWDILLRAFFAEFRQDEPVELHLVTHAFGSQVSNFPGYVRWATSQALSNGSRLQDNDLARVYLHTQHISDTTFPGVYRGADALVIPTRGEGWGRPQLEAMACGVPVITTNWSGLAAFINENVAYPLAMEGIVNTSAKTGWFQGQQWAQPSQVHLQQLMRHVTTNPADAAAKGAAGRQHIETSFSDLVVAKKARDEFLRMQGVVDALLEGR